MNIQFMTNENNGIPTGTKNWKGEENYRYIPDFTELLKNATCGEEIEAIEQCRACIDSGLLYGFTFSIVFTAKYMGKWQVMQHPWYYGASKEQMAKEIENMVNEMI